MTPPSDNPLDKFKSWLLPGALVLINLLLTTQIGAYTDEIKFTRSQMQEVLSTVKVQAAQHEFLTQRVNTLEIDKNRNAERISSLETRAAIFDEYMSGHKYD